MIPVRRVMREKRRVVMPLFVVLLANLVLLAVAVFPLARRVNGAEQRADAMRQSRLGAERELAAARATAEGKDRAARELQKFYAEVLPADQAAARRITYARLARLGREAGLDPGRGRFDAEPVKDSALSQLLITLELEGDYRSIRRFIYLLETAPEFTIIENVLLASAEEGVLRLTLELSTYYKGAADGD